MGKKKAENVVRDHMRALGTYKPEYDPVILMLCDLKRQYDVLTRQFEEGGYPYFEETSAGTKKAPIVVTLEGLRRDILQYYSQLGLTPQGLKRINDQAMAPEQKNDSPLLNALKELTGA